MSETFETTLNVVLIGFTAYYFVERFLKVVLAILHPQFASYLQHSRKEAIFFGISMGMLISLLSTQYCASAARSALAAATFGGQQHAQWSLDSDARICAVSRGILWVSEFNRLDMYTLYVVHHAGSLLALFTWFQLRWPSAVYLVLYTSLISEVPGDLVFMASTYGEFAGSQNQKMSVAAYEGFRRMKRRLVLFNALQYAVIRGGGLAGAIYILWLNVEGFLDRPAMQQVLGYALLAFYAVFCAAYVVRQIRSARHSCAGLQAIDRAVEPEKQQIVHASVPSSESAKEKAGHEKS